MSTYKALIKKLSQNNTEQNDFEDLYILSRHIVSDLPSADIERLEKHMYVIIALALNRNNGSVVDTEEYIKNLETHISTLDVHMLQKEKNNVVKRIDIWRPKNLMFLKYIIVISFLIMIIFIFAFRA